MSQELVVQPEPREYSVAEVVQRGHKIHEIMRQAMQDNHHYGVIPGTNKPTLLKPGAELLCMTFRLGPRYKIDTLKDGLHRDFIVTCQLWHTPTDSLQGEGVGSCSTREAKYAYRKAERVCPGCDKPAIIKGKAEYGGGWLCWKKKDGCGLTFAEGEQSIEGQTVGRMDNPDIADAYNTVLKMAQKRALIAAVLNVTAASDIFTQDVEDFAEPEKPKPAPKPERMSGDEEGMARQDCFARIGELTEKLGWSDQTKRSEMQSRFPGKRWADLPLDALVEFERELVLKTAGEATSEIPF